VRRRLFVAAGLDDAARAECARVADQLRRKRWPGRWVAPENYHLTVAFIGGVDEDRIADVIAAVHAVAARIPAVAVPLIAVGAFPNERKPRVAWVGSRAPVPAFGTLCGVVRTSLAALGFVFDAHADPHVTLARSDGSVALPPVEQPRSAPLRIQALTLYESITRPTGAQYTAIEHFPLDAGVS